ncbi:acid protease [Penicillium angulare]|uniref:penicillopepsin n=1 Tax=Penicillium angulare TaxID=116970 RepID=A0A9W9FCZ7_9EURO|nr:acid protease [Penicillium angulare]KAJ5097804.1 acid protease [Penicillium angulare]
MFGKASIAAVSLLALTATAAPLEGFNLDPMVKRTLQTRSDEVHVTSHKPAPFTSSRTPSRSSGHVMNLKKRSSNGPNTRSAAHKLNRRGAKSSKSATLRSLEKGSEYATSITFGNQTLEVIVDTGSSDTWAPELGFKCYDIESNNRTSTANCAFGPGRYAPSKSFKRIPGEVMTIGYGDGEYGSGYMGYENVTLAGISVNQTIGVISRAAWTGDDLTSGLVGLAYPAETGASNTTTHKEKVYDPIFTSMYKQGLVDSYFSLAISRNVSGDAGYLTLGGLPPIDFNETWASTDIIVTNVADYDKGMDFYTINIDGLKMNGKTLKKSGGKKNQYMVDSGTTLNYYPTTAANELANAFHPKATRNEDGTYEVDCDAKAPSHAITIDGTTFNINPLDMILYNGEDDDGNVVCQTGFVDNQESASEDVFILGDTFLKNVVAVFDVGASEMLFAPNEQYNNNDIY